MTSRPMRRKVTRPRTPAEGARLALAVVLTLALAAALCYVSTLRYVRMDWRSAARQPLTRDTRMLLARVNENIQVTIIHRTLSFPEDKQWMRALELAKQVLAQFSAANPRIAVGELNWSLPQDQARLQQIANDLNDKDLPTMCVLFTGAHGHRSVSFDVLVGHAGGPFAPPDAFVGESAFAGVVAGLTDLQALAPDPASGARRMRFFDMTPAHVAAARYVFIGGLPACFVVLGVVVWFVRRR